MNYERLRETLIRHLREHWLEELTATMLEVIFSNPGKALRWRFKLPGVPAVDIKISVDHDTTPVRTSFRRADTGDPNKGPMR